MDPFSLANLLVGLQQQPFCGGIQGQIGIQNETDILMGQVDPVDDSEIEQLRARVDALEAVVELLLEDD